MRYFLPQLAANDQPLIQSSLEEKFGGLPWGLPAQRWPPCRCCGSPQSLLGQLRHCRERLDLAREGRVLLVFVCNDAAGRCPTWDMNSGANSCFVVDAEELTQGLTMPPLSPDFSERRLARWLEEQVFPEWRVVRWIEREDGVPDAYPGFFGLHQGMPEGDDEEQYTRLWSEVSQETKLGSVPFWIQFPEVPPDGRFLGQIDSNCCQAFGDNGIGYIFLSGPASAPRGWFLWQCT